MNDVKLSLDGGVTYYPLYTWRNKPCMYDADDARQFTNVIFYNNKWYVYTNWFTKLIIKVRAKLIRGK